VFKRSKSERKIRVKIEGNRVLLTPDSDLESPVKKEKTDEKPLKLYGQMQRVLFFGKRHRIIVWIRKELRIHDNPCLEWAVK
jgi:hypothetical protein